MLLLVQGLKAEKIKVLTVNPAQTSTPMTWSRPDAEYLPDKMIQPDEIAEAIMMTFKLNPNVFIEVCPRSLSQLAAALQIVI